MFYILVATTISAAIYYYIKCITYWQRKGVPSGSVKRTIKETTNLLLKKRSLTGMVDLIYNMFPKSRYTGFYSTVIPILMIKDTDLLKDVTIKSFDHFTDHFNVIPDSLEPLWATNLFTLKGQRWRDMRQILSPSYTSTKMKTIFVLVSECAKNFSQHYLNKNEQTIEVDLKDSFTRFTNDVIATAGFGIKIDSLENQENQFYAMGKEMTNFMNGFANALKLVFGILFPKLFTKLKLSIFHKGLNQLFIDSIENTMTTRKQKGIVRPDMIHLLMEAQNELKTQKVEDASFEAQTEPHLEAQRDLTNLDIAAQALIFYFAGFESQSAPMCFMAYELATHPEIQQRLRDEIEETFENCQRTVTYDAILQMKYMDMVVSESLRKWPSNPSVDRQCTKSYTIEPKLPGEKPVHLKPKDVIWIPIYGIHHDPDNFPEPHKFDPERFSEENKGNIKPNTFIPFGMGQRMCIASRFALLEIKTLFFYLLLNFEIVPTRKSQIPVKISKANFNITAEGGFWFGLKKLKK